MIQLERGDVWGLAAATTAAVEAGLVGRLEEQGWQTARQLADALGLHHRGVERVLEVLVAATIVEARGEEYALSPALVKAHEAFPGGLGLTTALFTGTMAYVRSGVSPFAMDGSASERAHAYQATVGGLGQLFEAAAEAFARALPLAPRSVLDVGCGSGIWSLSLAARHPEMTVTGVDFPEVLEVFAEAAAARDVRVERVAGDMHLVPLPSAELVLLANVLRLEPQGRAKALVARLAAAVAPGGAVVIVDALAEKTPEREVARSVYALHLALRTQHAAVHSPATVRAWLEEAGLTVSSVDFGVWPGAVSALVGRRPCRR